MPNILRSKFLPVFLAVASLSVAGVEAQNANKTAPVFTTAQTAQQASPKQIVQDFYKDLREQKFREALMRTNWRIAVESFTPEESEELRRNFSHLADQANVEITGEQLSGAAASVFVKGKDPKTGDDVTDEVKLRRENGSWVIVFGDAETEAALKREGKNYFFKLWIENRHSEVQDVLEDVIKAQLVYSLQNNGQFSDLQTLVKQRLLPPEILGTELGYRFRLTLAPDKKKYAVNAEPVSYGKSGKLSFLLESAGAQGNPQIKSDDNGGQPFAVKN